MYAKVYNKSLRVERYLQREEATKQEDATYVVQVTFKSSSGLRSRQDVLELMRPIGKVPYTTDSLKHDHRF